MRLDVLFKRPVLQKKQVDVEDPRLTRIQTASSDDSSSGFLRSLWSLRSPWLASDRL